MNAKPKKYALEYRVAPDLDPVWTEAVILELRLRGVSGQLIGAALAEVNNHCVESGQSAQEAFGDPVDYAIALDLPEDPRSRTNPRDIVGSVLQVAGIAGYIWAVGGLLSGDRANLTWGVALSFVLSLAAVLALLRAPEATLRFVVASTPRSILFFLFGFIIVMLCPLLLRDVLIALPALPVVIFFVALLALGTIILIRAERKDGGEDPVLSPLEKPAPRRWYFPAWALLPVMAIVITTMLVMVPK